MPAETASETGAAWKMFFCERIDTLGKPSLVQHTGASEQAAMVTAPWVHTRCDSSHSGIAVAGLPHGPQKQRLRLAKLGGWELLPREKLDTSDKASLRPGELEQLLLSSIANGWDK